MKIIASYNIKGGVGKTATVVNLGYLAAAEGWRCLIWDLDPQGAASFYFRIKPKVKSGAKGLFERKRELADVIKGTDFDNLDLIPADFSYRNMDLLLQDGKSPVQRLHKLLKPFAKEYDYILLDCPPSISLVSESIFYAADALLIPMIPTTLSMRTLEQFLKFRKSHDLMQLNIMPFFTMVDMRKNLHRLLVENPPLHEPAFLKSKIPYASEVEQMGIHRAPLFSFAAHSRGAQAYRLLWEEVKERLHDENRRLG